MPFPRWTVEPVFLSREALPPDKPRDDLDTKTNVALVRAMRQLACLARIADHVFTDVTEACAQLSERAYVVTKKIQTCEAMVADFNAKKVKIPVADLVWFSQLQDHYHTNITQESVVFSPETRPIAVKSLYAKAFQGPVPRAFEPIISACRTKPTSSFLEIETMRPGGSWGTSDDRWETASEPGPHRLPSPEERMLAQSVDFPAAVVAVDVSGASFERMSSVRRSLLHVDFFIKRKKKKRNKRRNTIAEGDNKELQEVLKKCHQASLVDSSCQTDLDSDTPKPSHIFKRFSFRNSAEKNNNQPNRRSFPLVSKSDDNGLYQTVDLNLTSKSSKKKQRSVDTTPEKVVDPIKKNDVQKKSKSKSYLPISTLSAAMSVAVKMRQSFKKGGDDGRSSSGNWSASSSTRASVDSSDQQAPVQSSNPETPTDSSIDKDSMLSDTQDTESRLQDFTSDASTRTNSDRPRTLSLQQLQTTDWVTKLDPSNTSSSTQENYFSDTSTPLVRSPYARRKKEDGEPSPPRLDDEESSVYSIDTDGYYTSMHTDSGLKTKNPQATPEKAACNFRSRKDSDSSTLDTISLNSLLSRTATEMSSRSNSLTREKRGPPPQPPQRVSSIKPQKNKDSTPTGDVSESEPECRERLRQKTSINSSRYPSMCAVSPEPSDEDDATKTGNKTSEDISVTSESMNSLESARFIDETDKNKKENVDMGDSCSTKNACVVRNPPVKRNGKDNPCRNTVIFIPDPQQKDTTIAKKEDVNQTKVKMPNLTDFSRISNDSRASSIANSREHLSSASSTSSSPSSPSSKSDSSPVLPPPMPLVDAVYKSFSPLSTKNGYSFKHASLRRDGSSPCTTASLSRTSTPTQGTVVKSSTVPNFNSKPVARVTLDPNGKVIYSSNSLGRRRDGHPLSNGAPSFNTEPRFATLPLPSMNMVQTACTAPKSQVELKVQAPAKSQPIIQFGSSNFQRNIASRSTLPKNFSVPAMGSVPHRTPSSYGRPPTSLGNHVSTSSLTSPSFNFNHLQRHQASTPIQRSYTPDPTTKSNFNTFTKPDTSSHINPHRPNSRSIPSPIPQYNLGLKRSPQYPMKPPQNKQFFTPPSTPLTPQPENVIKPSPTFPPTTKPPNTTTPRLQQPQIKNPSSQSSSPDSLTKSNPTRKSMSPADLYAIIHNSKKRLNIKSDLDQSMSPHSSRSSSPPTSLGRPATPNRNGLAETGFLMPRGDLTNAQKRRSWVGDGSPSLFTPGERRSLAQDRLGPSKPTSIHDFKMLLLQTKTSGGSGISAAERLKSLPKRSDSPAVSPTSPQTPPERVNGHCTPPAPAKRNPRTKFNIQTRYDLKCEPILEDTSEDGPKLLPKPKIRAPSSSTWV